MPRNARLSAKVYKKITRLFLVFGGEVFDAVLGGGARVFGDDGSGADFGARHVPATEK